MSASCMNSNIGASIMTNMMHIPCICIVHGTSNEPQHDIDTHLAP